MFYILASQRRKELKNDLITFRKSQITDNMTMSYCMWYLKDYLSMMTHTVVKAKAKTKYISNTSSFIHFSV